MAKRLKGFKKIPLAGLDCLRGAKNLLGFSAGVDSSALFFLLLAHGVDFDIAIVNYHTRKNSNKEVRHARHLADKFHKKIFIHDARIAKNNFESRARAVRLEFFARVINEEKYTNLILANQLNDRLEWFFMQLTKGGGLNSLLGFNFKQQYKNFFIIRPLFYASRTELEGFLKRNKIKFFIDKSNKDKHFLRNYFRAHFTNKLSKSHAKGISSSLAILREEFSELYGNNSLQKIALENDNFIAIFARGGELANLHCIDICAKELGYIISRAQRNEVIKSRFSCVLGDKIIIDSNDTFIFVTSKTARHRHEKGFRDTLRRLKIPPKIRGYISNENLCELKLILDSK